MWPYGATSSAPGSVGHHPVTYTLCHTRPSASPGVPGQWDYQAAYAGTSAGQHGAWLGLQQAAPGRRRRQRPQISSPYLHRFVGSNKHAPQRGSAGPARSPISMPFSTTMTAGGGLSLSRSCERGRISRLLLSVGRNAHDLLHSCSGSWAVIT